MFFKKQIKISNNFGPEYIESVVAFLKHYFSISFMQTKEIEMDLTYFDYKFDGETITFISEGMSGTSILGKVKTVRKIVKTVADENPKLFDYLLLKPNGHQQKMG